jgi:hypothetical protein
MENALYCVCIYVYTYNCKYFCSVFVALDPQKGTIQTSDYGDSLT